MHIMTDFSNTPTQWDETCQSLLDHATSFVVLVHRIPIMATVMLTLGT